MLAALGWLLLMTFLGTAQAQNQTPPNDPPSMNDAIKLFRDTLKQVEPVTLTVYYRDPSGNDSYYYQTWKPVFDFSQVSQVYWQHGETFSGPPVPWFPSISQGSVDLNHVEQVFVSPIMSSRFRDEFGDRVEPQAWTVEFRVNSEFAFQRAFLVFLDESLANRVAKGFERAAEIAQRASKWPH
jgi:hypothetical protein